ncbi:hypothetical protein BGZ81_009199, partial [Podila clonocystis]
FYIRDTKSSSGTFLNHARLSPPGVESKPAQLKDGDVVQLGVDYQGGTQEIYRCVKMRLELNRSWQQQANPFRLNTLKVIRNLTTADAANSTDCCICLFRIASFQSLFVAPCSHVYHYKCIRPMLVANHPGFLCPLCRTFADLEDTVEIDDPIEQPAIENNAVEQVEEEPATVANPDPPVTTPILEDSIPISTATPAAITPPEDTPAQESSSSAAEDVEMPQAVTEDANHSRSTSTPASPTSRGAPASPSSGTSAAPLQIAIPQSASGSRLSVNLAGSSSSQQSPSSAFFLAPSPPAFISGFGVSPVPFSTSSSSSSRNSLPTQTQAQSPPPQSHNSHSVSPSNHMSHMFQNFVRNITPSRSRSRSRTNSNSASLSPVVPTPTLAAPSQGSSHHGILSHIHLHHHNNEGHSDVFGKTLVVSPTPIMMSNSRHGISELGSVSEMESEPVSRDDSSSSSGRSSRGGDEMSDDALASGEQSPSTSLPPQVHLTPSEAQPVVV